MKKGISLIVLIITIIIIIILSLAVIISILDNNPIIEARRAVDESNISNYTEQIELIRGKIILKNKEYIAPTIYQMEEELKKEKWVITTEIIIDEEVEKLKIVTKKGYIFYITEDDVEYKGKGSVVDTSALKRDDVLELKAEETTSKGQYVKITNLAQDYYTIKYKIGEEEQEWTEIKSGEKVEVEYGKTIYANLFYGSNEGIEVKLKIDHTNPSIVAKTTNTSNIKRKINNKFANLFDITWGSEGTGTVKYEVSGNMLFNGVEYSSTSVTNTKELELGTYNVKCTIKSPKSEYTTSAVKENVKITTLANSSVENASGNNVNANAIYSEYDLAHFRDLVNKNGQTTINAKVMNDIILDPPVGNQWEPINRFDGIFEGNNHSIDGIYINLNENYVGFFSFLNESGNIRNFSLKNVNITGNYYTGGLVGWNNSNKNIENCSVSGIVSGNEKIGGIIGYSNKTTASISNCSVHANVTGNVHVGGIVGFNNSTIQHCGMYGNTTANITDKEISMVGGIAGELNSNYIFSCVNKGNVTGKSYVGGITGDIRSGTSVSYCYNTGNITASGQTNLRSFSMWRNSR